MKYSRTWAYAFLAAVFCTGTVNAAGVPVSRVNYLGRFDDNYDGRLSAKNYVAFL